MKKNLFLIFFNIILINSILADHPETKGLSYITGENLFKTVEYLASKELNGRSPGSNEFEKAALFISDNFHKINLKPYGNKSYYQKFNVEYNEILSPCKLNLSEDGKVAEEFKLGKDFVCRVFTGSGTFTTQVAFCGYGISMPGIYDDYKKADVKGKIALVFKPNPSWKIKNKEWTPVYERTKASVAKAHGAIGIFYVSLPLSVEKETLTGSSLHGEGIQDTTFPQLHISVNAADKFIQQSGYSLKHLQQYIDSMHIPFSMWGYSNANVEVHTKYYKEKSTENIIGIIEGSDKTLKDEYIVVGAHLDHVGGQAGEIYFPGANDNASGSATVIEIAKAFQKAGIKPKRSIAFVLFTSEEQGMLGSNYFIDNFNIKHDKIVAMLNIDCVGHGDSLRVRSGKISPELWKIAKNNDSKYTNIMIGTTTDEVGADAGPFLKNDIPSLSFVTTNSYEFLHAIGDTPSTINRTLHEKVTKLAFLITQSVANGEYSKEIIPDKFKK